VDGVTEADRIGGAWVDGAVRAALCSRNENKLRELAALLPRWELELLGAREFPEEAGPTYYDNARAKARFGRAHGDPDAWMLGEDSGLEVAGLGGAPGVRSARYAPEGPAAIAKLLRELRGIEGEGRRARYVCELVAVSPEGAELRGTGVLEGRIAEQACGSEGFGYDPVFVPAGEDRTVAELGDAWKSRNSHRARAARALLEQTRLGDSPSALAETDASEGQALGRGRSGPA
jgi:XTP/dITP diphosphohydrolase